MLVAYLGCPSVSSGLAHCTILFGRICSRAYPKGLGGHFEPWHCLWPFRAWHCTSTYIHTMIPETPTPFPQKSPRIWGWKRERQICEANRKNRKLNYTPRELACRSIWDFPLFCADIDLPRMFIGGSQTLFEGTQKLFEGLSRISLLAHFTLLEYLGFRSLALWINKTSRSIAVI